MQRILRPFLLLALLVAATAGLVACGGGGDDGGGGGGGKSSDDGTDVNTVLNRVFSSDQKIDKGKLNVSAKVNATGSSGGTFDVSFSGPFESQGKEKTPKFDFDVAFSGAGQNLKAGAENTGSKAFVNYNGTEYVVDDATYKQFVQGYEQAAKQSASQNGGKTSLDSLGIDPKDWLKNPKNAGEGSVEGEDVVKITGDVDVPKMLADVNTLVQKAGSLGLSGQANVPDKLTDDQIAMAEKAIKKLSIEVDAAKDDSSLRKMLVTLSAVNPDNSSEKIDATLDITLSDVGESQDFPEPSGAKPFSELLSQFGGLGALGGAGASSGSGSSSGSSTSSSASQKKLKEYTDCLEAAGSDSAKAQACASKLG